MKNNKYWSEFDERRTWESDIIYCYIDRDIPLVEQYPPSAPSNKTAVETTTEPSTPLSSSDKNQPEPILVESEESEEEEDDNYNTYHRQQQRSVTWITIHKVLV